jgi:hypothetical protein
VDVDLSKPVTTTKVSIGQRANNKIIIGQAKEKK